MSVGLADLSSRVAFVADTVRIRLARQGAIVQVSGGVDSAVTLHLCAKALGCKAVLALFMPDRDSDPTSHSYAERVAESAGCALQVISIDQLWHIAAYRRNVNRIVERYFPSFDPSSDAYSVNFDRIAALRIGTACFRLHVGKRHGVPRESAALSATDLRHLIAAQNIKQRLRMTLAYAEADASSMAVIGASNADEIDLGFVVKHGDDAADIYPIADLAKDGVRKLAVELDVPKSIRDRTPTTDTFGLTQSQEDYFFGIAPALLRRLMAAPDVAAAEGLCRAEGHEASDARALLGIARSLAWTVRYNSATFKMTSD